MLCRAEVVRERERQPEQAGDLGAVAAGTEQPHRRLVPDGRHREHRPVAVEVGHQLGELLGEVVGAKRIGAPAQRAAVRGSVPGARPMPRSIRPGCNASRVPNCSATTSGWWLGSITPPDPTRIREVAAGQVRDQHGGRRAADARHAVVLGHPVPPEAELLDPADQRGAALRAAVAVDPEPMGTRSSTERGTTRTGATRFPLGVPSPTGPRRNEPRQLDPSSIEEHRSNPGGTPCPRPHTPSRVRPIRVPAGTTAGAAVRAAGLPSSGCERRRGGPGPGRSQLRDLAWVPDADVEVEPVGADSDDGRSVIRHSAAHVLAQAVQQLRPDAKLGIGPPITDGFYYDFDVDMPFTPDDLRALESAMKKIIKAGQRFSRRRYDSLDDARKELADEPYKLELIDLKGGRRHRRGDGGRRGRADRLRQRARAHR